MILRYINTFVASPSDLMEGVDIPTDLVQVLWFLRFPKKEIQIHFFFGKIMLYK